MGGALALYLMSLGFKTNPGPLHLNTLKKPNIKKKIQQKLNNIRILIIQKKINKNNNFSQTHALAESLQVD